MPKHLPEWTFYPQDFNQFCISKEFIIPVGVNNTIKRAY